MNVKNAFIASAVASMRWCVSALSGVCTETTSASCSSASSDTCCATSRKSSAIAGSVVSKYTMRIENAPRIGDDDFAEGVIGGRKDDDFVAGRGHGLKDETEPGYDPRRLTHPAWVHAQTMAARHPIHERCGPASGVGVIAVGGSLNLGGERCRHARRRGEVHVRDPHRNRIRRLDAGQTRHVVPLRGVGAAAFNNAVEVEHETAAPVGNWRGRSLMVGAARPVKIHMRCHCAWPHCPNIGVQAN